MNDDQIIPKGKPRGRQGGRKKLIKNPVKIEAYIDRSDLAFYKRLGAGNFSAGVRRARRIIEGKEEK